MRNLMFSAVSLLLAGAVLAAPHQPTPEMLTQAKERFAWLVTISGNTPERIVTNLEAYFGQDFEGEQDKGRANQTDVYLVRRNPATGHVTFRELVGSMPPAE